MGSRKIPTSKKNYAEYDESTELEFTENPGGNHEDDPFLDSLDKLREKDISGAKSPKNGKKKKISPVRTVTLVISLAVFVTCAVYLVFNLIQKKQGQEFYDNLAKEYFGGISFSGGEQKDDGAVKRLVKISSASKVLCLSDRLALGANVVSGDYDEKLAEMRASLTALSEQNPDTYGWITVPGTNINYPIMQTSDNEFYLDHIYDGSYRVVGSIFADWRNNKTIYRNFNTVLYGHNMTDGSMFHDVVAFLNEDVFRNTLIYIYTMDGVYVYEPFSVFETRADYNYFRTEFASTADFIAFAEEMQRNSKFQKNMEFLSTDKMITLSTCTNSTTQIGRYCLQAKLVQVIS